MRDEMVMVREHSPGFELPAVVPRDRKQAAVQHAEPVRPTEVMGLRVGAGSNEERAIRRKLMDGCVRPGSFWCGHEGTVSSGPGKVQLRGSICWPSGTAVEDYRSPRRFATVEGGGKGPP